MEPTSTRIGPYELQELLAEGGMSKVYRALDTRSGELVALKLLHPSMTREPADAARFRREVQLASAVVHPSLLRVLDCSPAGSRESYLVTELVEGESLRTYAAQRLLPELAALLLLPVARGLGAAHAAGIVHRDVKPDNMLVDRRGGRTAIRLGDFGVAVRPDDPRITDSRMLSGSIHYMAPEVITDALVSPAADIWSLGISLYELASGAPPFTGRPNEILARITRETPSVPAAFVAPRLADVLARCLAPDPEMRFADGDALAGALAAALAASGLDRPEQELEQWGQDPTAHAPRLAQRLADRLVERACAAGSPSASMELLEQALALAPHHGRALTLLALGFKR